jgi:hypothetical protein
MAAAGCGADDGGAASKEALVSAYVKAVAARDEPALKRLVHPDREASRAIRRLLRRWGGRRLSTAPVMYRSYDGVYEQGANCDDDPPGTGALAAAVLRTRSASHVLHLTVDDGRCYLALEQDQPPPPDPALPVTVEGWEAPGTG